MNKLFSKIAALSVGLAMAVGVGVAVGSQSGAVKVSATDIPASNLSSSSTCTVSGTSGVKANKGVGATITVPKEAGSCDVTFHAAAWNKEGVAHDVTYTNATSSTTSITLTADSGISGSGSSYTLNGSESDYVFTVSLTQTSSSDDMVINIAGVSNKRFVVWGASYGGEPAETYTVSFNGNGGTGEMSSVSGVSGNYKLPDNGFTAPSGKVFGGWKAGNAGDLIPAGGSYNVGADVTFFAQWADAYNVYYSAGEHGSGSFSHGLQPGDGYKLLAFSELEGVSADSGYRFKNYTVAGIDKNPGETVDLNAATTITVNFEVAPMETTYDFTEKFSTYASAWTNSYISHEGLNGVSDIGGDYAATIDLYKASKQGSNITTMPVFGTKTAAGNWTKVLQFTLNESDYKIDTISVEFSQWTTKKPDVALFKGNNVSGTALDTATIGEKNTLSALGFNGTVFSIGYCDKNESSNVQSGLKSITISLLPLSSFGTLDHITITALPNTVYHVGETYNSNGLSVTAYDGVNESTANFKDVTSSVVTDLDNPIAFDDDDVPGLDCNVTYTGDGGSDTKSFHVSVYALAQYELVTSELEDWSGNYLIVSTKDEDLVAFNGGLTILDDLGNYKTVTATDDVIEAGQELEWAIAKNGDYYSLKGKNNKFIGSPTASDQAGLLTSDSAINNTISITGSDVTIKGTNNYSLKYNSGSSADRFRYYSGGTVKLYKLKTSDKADEYAQTFLGAIACDASGESEPDFNIKEGELKWSWALLAAEYDELSPNEKETFRLGVASKTGNNIEQALARYDYIVGKYGTTKYSDFMNRNPAPIPNNNIGVNSINSDNNMMIIIVVISSITVLSLGVLLALKKRKHN